MNAYNRKLRRFFNTTLLLQILAFAFAARASAGVWDTVPLGGGGYVIGLASNANGSSIYCRTDVGGAFLWVPAADGMNGSWISLTDAMVPFGTAGASSLMNVESICTDPNNASQVYIGAGSGGIWSSNNQGSTWSLITPTGWGMQGNGADRMYGERMTVDPNNSNILWYGSDSTGLHKGVLTSGTWVWTQIPSTSVPFGTSPIGIPFVVCDKNNGVAGDTIVYAGVNGASGGVYVSTNSGSTWALVGGATLTTPRRAQIAKNGTLYVTGGSAGVAKLTRGGSLALVNPSASGPTWHGVAVDPNDATGNTVYVADISSADIWRSSNGGTSWSLQSGYSAARTEPDGTPCLVGYWFGDTSSMLVNPANSNQLLLGDFFGVSSTWDAADLGGTGSTWYTLQKGQEETVVMAVKSAPSGADLLTGVSDVGGFLYNNIASRPYGTAGSSFGNPSGGNNTSLDFCESNPTGWVRAYVNSSGSAGTGAISHNGGVNWVTFGELDAQNITNSSTGGWVTFDVGPFLKQQKALGNNTVSLCVKSSSSQTNAAYLHFSSTQGSFPPQIVLNGTTTIVSEADSSVSMSSPTTNYGTNAELWAQNYYNQANYTKESFLMFNLSTVSSITSGTLQLYRLPETDTHTYLTTISATATTSWTQTGITWNTMPTDFYGPSSSLWGGRVAVSSADPASLVWVSIGVGSPAYYSKDRGVSWTASTGGPGSQISGIYTNGGSLSPSAQCLTADRGNGEFYFAKFGGSTHIIYSSTNGGATWTQVGTVSNGNSYNFLTPQIVAAPVSPTCPTGGDMWLCDDGTYNGNGGGLWRSTNAGVTWSSVGGGAGKITAVSFGKSSTGSGYSVYIYGHVNSTLGVYRSDNYGTTWVQLTNPTIEPVLSLGGDHQSYNSVFLGTNGRGTFHYNSNKFEAESLAVQSYTTTDTEEIITDPNFSDGAAVELVSVAVGDQITFVVPGVTAGSYDITIGVKKYNNRGIWQLAIGPAGGSFTNLGSPQDNYSASANFTSIDMGTWTPTSSSDKWFRFTITGKNASSSAYTEVVDYITLTPK